MDPLLEFLIGLLLIIIGSWSTISLTNKRLNGDKGGYGGHIKIYFGSIGFIIIGLAMMIEVIVKLLK